MYWITYILQKSTRLNFLPQMNATKFWAACNTHETITRQANKTVKGIGINQANILSRLWGASKSISGPLGTMRVGLT